MKRLIRDDYEKGLCQFVERFQQKYKQKAAFYQFGAIRSPGVSDIDLLVVTEDERWQQACDLGVTLINSSTELNYLFVHPPLIICESLVEYLRTFHTLESCHQIAGTWDPLANVDAVAIDDGLLLIQHSVWNSFMRVAALEMDRQEIGLRRVLILLHNLLTSAKRGNQFLERSVPIPLSTEEIREAVLAAPDGRRAMLVKEAIDQVIAVLNTVDHRLDIELGVVPVAPMIVPSQNYYLVAPLSTYIELKGNNWHKLLLKKVSIVRTPNYLVAIAALLAQHLDDLIPEIAVYSDGRPLSMLRGIDVIDYAEQVRNARKIFQKHGLRYFFVLPFSFHTRPIQGRYRLKEWIYDRMVCWQAKMWRVI